MATDLKLLQGEVNDHPDQTEVNVESLLAGFLRALVEEQAPNKELPAEGPVS